MNFMLLLKNSIYSIKNNKIRVLLTMIGIIIGISSVTTIMALGEGVKHALVSSLEEESANSGVITFDTKDIRYSQSISPFKQSDISMVKRVDGIKNVKSSLETDKDLAKRYSSVNYFNKSSPLSLVGYNNNGITLIAGRGFLESELNSTNRIIILRENVAKVLTNDNPKDIISKYVNINGVYFKVIGLIDDSTGSFPDQNDYMPKEALGLIKVDTSNDIITSLTITVHEGSNIKKVLKNATIKLNKII